MMQEGFFRVGRHIYYGAYPKEQVSGFIRLSVVKPEYFMTDRPFIAEESAVNLYDNHDLTEPELLALQQALATIASVLKVTESREGDFGETEARLGAILPPALIIAYGLIGQRAEFTTGAERFLLLSEIYRDGNSLIFYKAKRTPAALSLTDGLLMRWRKKAWQGSLGDESLLNFILERIIVKAIMAMPLNKTGKIKGELRNALSPEAAVRAVFQGQLKPLEAYENYGHMILYNEAGALAWFRQNGFYADILFGCTNNALFSSLMAVDLPAVWK